MRVVALVILGLTIFINRAWSADILVIGDSLAMGIGYMIAHQNHHVTNAAIGGSGLVRPDIYDWPRQLPRLLANGRFDFAVVALGTNDRGLPIGRHDFNSEEWRAAYAGRVRRIMEMLENRHLATLWLGPPCLMPGAGDTYAQIITDLQRESSLAYPNIHFVSMREWTSNGDTCLRTIRLRDGIHFTNAGYHMLAERVSEVLF